MKKRIVFITDCTDVAYNELRGTIFSLVRDRDNIEIEPVVPVALFSIINGNFILRLMGEIYPRGTIFCIILNPLKERSERLIGKTRKKEFLFMGGNTGTLDWFLREFGIKELYELHEKTWLPFTGKYIFTPTVAQIAMGRPLKEMGKPFNAKNVRRLDMPSGTIVHIDNFGLIKFIGKLPKANEGDKFLININGKIINAVYARRMMSRNTGEWVIYPGSSLGLPEIGKVRQNCTTELGIKIGDRIKFNKL